MSKVSLSFGSLLPLDIIKHILSFDGTCIFLGEKILDVRYLLNIPKITFICDYLSQVRFDIKPKLFMVDTFEPVNTCVLKSYELVYVYDDNTVMERYSTVNWCIEHQLYCYNQVFVWEKDVGIRYHPIHSYYLYT